MAENKLPAIRHVNTQKIIKFPVRVSENEKHIKSPAEDDIDNPRKDYYVNKTLEVLMQECKEIL